MKIDGGVGYARNTIGMKRNKVRCALFDIFDKLLPNFLINLCRYHTQMFGLDITTVEEAMNTGAEAEVNIFSFRPSCNAISLH